MEAIERCSKIRIYLLYRYGGKGNKIGWGNSTFVGVMIMIPPRDLN
jgi:hypothetical protein